MTTLGAAISRCEGRCECDAFTGISHFSHPDAPCEFVRFAPVRTFRTAQGGGESPGAQLGERRPSDFFAVAKFAPGGRNQPLR
jgi:hypothetical protein